MLWRSPSKQARDHTKVRARMPVKARTLAKVRMPVRARMPAKDLLAHLLAIGR